MSNITWTTGKAKLGDLIEYERNPVQISERAAKELAKSLKKFGHIIPYTAAAPKNGSKIPILDGHQRKKVEMELLNVSPNTVVEVRFPSRKLTEKERQEAIIRLRKNTGEFDTDALLNWFESDDLLDWGFDAKELEKIGFEFDGGADAEPEIDRAAELLEKWKVKTGDLWQIGEHRLICGDCTDAAVVDRVMGGERAGACVTDPPYGQNQEDVTDDDPEGNPDLLSGCVAQMPIDNGIVIAFESPRMFPNWMKAIINHKFLRALWLYKEAQMANPWRGWILKSEMILISEIGKGEWLDVHPFAHDCYKVSEVSYRTEKVAPVRTHGSVKPLAIVQDLVSRVGGDVYEPFLGSGTTMAACQNLQRKCYAIEKDPAYVAVALERMSVAFPHLKIERVKHGS